MDIKVEETPRFKVNKILIGFILNDNIDSNGTNEILTIVESLSEENEELKRLNEIAESFGTHTKDNLDAHHLENTQLKERVEEFEKYANKHIFCTENGEESNMVAYNGFKRILKETKQ